jgi:3-deoxy-D-manno-octulosonic acid kinase
MPPIAPTLSLEPCAHGFALVNRARVHAAVETLFDVAGYPQAKPLREGRGQAFQVRAEFGAAALRHYRRGGLTGVFWQDRYPYFGAERTRCFRELRLLAALYAQGLPVPERLACRFVRQGLIYRADLLSSWLEGAAPLSADVLGLSAAQMQQIGAMLKRFHRVGLWHADLNAHNVLLTDQGMALIDFDRCVLHTASEALPSWTQANLERLRRSLTKLGFAARTDFSNVLWPALMDAYRDG